MNRTVSFGAYVALWVFALALALIEAAVVIYLRKITGEGLFPVNRTLQALGPQFRNLEVCREVATLIILLMPALLLQVPALLRIVVYILAFALWDLGYYAFLRMFIDWPSSLMAYDVLFLIPRPWIAPVACPVLLSATLALGSSLYLYLSRNRAARAPGVIETLALIIGAGVMLLSFLWETDYYMAGGMPPRFAWWLFLSGYGIMLVGGAYLLIQYSRQEKARFF